MEIWSIFDWWREYHPNPPIMENTMTPKFSKRIRMLDSFIKNFSRKALPFEFAFLFSSSGLRLKPTGKVWLLIAFAVLFSCVSLKVKLMFLHLFKYVLTSYYVCVCVWVCVLIYIIHGLIIYMYINLFFTLFLFSIY